ncbi:MAG: hypothetical protein U1A78_04325 [Polyangia bacterium]
MGLDLRLPMGALFAAIGLVLAAYGLLTRGDAMYQRSLGLNVNLGWGLVLLAFGALLLALRARDRRRG